MADKKAFLLRVDHRRLGGDRPPRGDRIRSLNAEIEYLLRDALARRGIVLKKAVAKPREPRGADD